MENNKLASVTNRMENNKMVSINDIIDYARRSSSLNNTDDLKFNVIFSTKDGGCFYTVQIPGLEYNGMTGVGCGRTIDDAIQNAYTKNVNNIKAELERNILGYQSIIRQLESDVKSNEDKLQCDLKKLATLK
jgi:hypothetical protein